jgi:DNA-entry nuclease
MARKRKKNNKNSIIIAIIVVVVLSLLGCLGTGEETAPETTIGQSETVNITDGFSVEVTSEETVNEAPDIETTDEKATENDGVNSLKGDLPQFDGKPYVAVNGNEPEFTAHEITDKYFEIYEPLDRYGRCTVAFACLGKETMPTEERGEIGSVKPTGWHTVKYDCVDGKYLYNRCHLIGFQLSGENANKRNLITGTRYMNVDGMLPFENMVDDYIEETGNHVMYRVTPVFEGDDLVARGVQMEAYSVEDEGEGICFNVFCFNNQPGVLIDYATGESVAE